MQHDLDTDKVAVYFRLYLLLYADDTVILAESAAELQASLNAMYLYCQTWKMQVNISKTKVVIFSRSRLNTDNMNFKYSGESLNIVKNFQYLGIIFSCKGNFNDAKAHLVQQARKAMFIVLRKARKLNLPIDMQLELFDTMVVPILLYGAEVWVFENCNIIENLHMQFCKIILKVKKSTAHCMIYGELGRIPLHILIKARMVGFWQRIMCGKREKNSYTLYSILYQLSKRGIYHSKWLLDIKNTLYECGFNLMWDNQIIAKSDNISKNVKKCLSDKFMLNWSNNVMNSAKCLNYRIYKSDFCFEKYLTVLPSDLRMYLCKFRCLSNKLPIETGRFFNIDRSERHCNLCNANELGDEFHYLFKCTFFKNVRAKFLPLNICKNPNVLKFKELMNTSDLFTLTGIAKFCKSVIKTF